MQEPETWRDLLRGIISDPREKQRIAQELGIRPITLTRWINNESAPRPQNLRNLVNVIPQHRDELIDLIREEEGFEEFEYTKFEDASQEIPSLFYARVFNSRATTIESMRYWSVTNLILQQAIGQLDPDRQGMAIQVIRCMPPATAGHKVLSLREGVGVGVPPWGGELEQKAMFLGAESLCGYTVSLCRPSSIQNLEEEQIFFPARKVAYEKSAAAYPILYAGRIAGCLLVSSTQTNYFLSQTRLKLIENYANLLALAFDAAEYYTPEQIELRIMPDEEVQQQYFANFRQRVSSALLRAAKNRQPLNTSQAEQMVWQQLELEMLQLAT